MAVSDFTPRDALAEVLDGDQSDYRKAAEAAKRAGLPEGIEVHHIELEFWGGHTSATAICTAEDGADCRLCCTEECESWGDIERIDGKPFHRPSDDDQRHAMKDIGYCNVCEFLNADSDPFDLATEDAQFTVRVPIEPKWAGDYYEWKQVTP